MTDLILKAICKKYQISKEQLCVRESKKQRKELVEAKQTAIHLLWINRCGSGKEIAGMMGYAGKSYTHFAHRQIKKIAEGNKAFRDELEELKQSLLRN